MVAVSVLVFGPRESFASPLPHSPALGILSYRAPTSQCSGFEGNPDLYGLGIRVGVYLQWVSGVVAHSFHADSVPDLLATNTIFLLALFTALAIITTKKTVQAIEVAILLQFCFGFLTTVSSTWGLRVRSRLKSPGEYGNRVSFPLLGSTIRVCLASAICLYNAWFWFNGIENLGDNTCRTGFLFAPVDLLRRARIFLKITSILLAIVSSIAAIFEVLLFLSNWMFYAAIALVVAVAISFHHRVYSGARSNKMPIEVAKILLKSLKFAPAALVAIPWLLMNRDTDLGLKTLQSWFLIATILALLAALFTTVFCSFSDNFSWYWDCLSFINRTPKSKPSPTSRGSRSVDLGVRNATSISGTTPATIGTGQIQDEAVFEGLKRSDLQAEMIVSSDICISPPDSSLPEERGNDSPETGTSPPTLEVSTKLITLGKKTTGFRVFTNLVKNPWRLASSVTFLDHSALKAIPILNLACLVWSIIAIELTITWNNISEVHTIQSVGQLIPFIIGVVGFLKLLRDISVEKTELLIYNTVLNALLDFDVVNIPETAPLEVKDLITSREENNGQKNTMKGTKPHSPLKVAIGSLSATIYMTLNLRKEVHEAKSTPMLQRSIGDQIISILENDANNTEPSVQKMNAILALEIVKRAQGQPINPAEPAPQVQSKRRKFWDDLHHVDIDPNALALRWLKVYMGYWWNYLKGRWMKRREELVARR